MSPSAEVKKEDKSNEEKIPLKSETKTEELKKEDKKVEAKAEKQTSEKK